MFAIEARMRPVPSRRTVLIGALAGAASVARGKRFTPVLLRLRAPMPLGALVNATPSTCSASQPPEETANE